MSCQHFGDQPADAQALFEYFAFTPTGKVGTLAPVLHAASGLCWYPGATCGPGAVPDDEDCCRVSEYGKSFAMNGWIIWAVVGGMCSMYVPMRCETCKKRFKERGEGTWGEQMKALEDKIDESAADLRPQSKALQAAGGFFMMIALGLTIQISIQMNEIAQKKLSAVERNGMVVAEGVLNPMDDIFSFIDDIILVKVGIALAAGDAFGLRKAFFLGTMGGFCCGVLGALVATLVAFVGPIRDQVLDPFRTTAGCTLSQADPEVIARYFALSAWQWPFTFACNGFAGFAMSVGDFGMFGLVMLARALSALIPILTVFASTGSLQVLGWIRLGSAALGFLLWVAATVGRAGMRRRLGFGGDVVEATASGPAPSFFADESTRQALKDGLMAMLTELCVEMARTITLFVTARTMGVAAFYQVSTHYTLQIAAGMGAAEAIFINMKLQGSKLLSGGLNYHFTWFFEFMAFGGFAIAIGSWVTTYTGTMGFALNTGKNACVWASEEACLVEYGNFWGGGVGAVGATMKQVVFTVAPIVTVRIAYRICRSTLYAMQDFAWMVKISLGCFFVFFVPGVATLGATSDSAVAAVLVMTIPNATVLVAFAIRVGGHLRLLAAGTNAVFEKKTSFVRQRTGELQPNEETPATIVGKKEESPAA